MTATCDRHMFGDPDLPTCDGTHHPHHTYSASAGADLDGPHQHANQEDQG